jgi:hypothetical protein
VLREFKEVLTNALADSKAVHVDGLGNKQINTHLFFVKLNHQPIFLYF